MSKVSPKAQHIVGPWFSDKFLEQQILLNVVNAAWNICVALGFAKLFDSKRSMGLHVRVCVRQREFWEFQGWRKGPPTEFSRAK